MTLEDQIRRMGEARASEVTTPSWRDRVGAGRRTPWLLAAAAVVAVIVAIGAVAVLSEDDADTDVAGPDGTTVGRWVPPGGVWEISYGASPGAVFFTVPGQEVALVTTPDDAASPADADWTWISVGPQPLLFALSEGGDSGPRDGYFEFGTDDGNVLIVSERLTGDDLTGVEDTLRAADGDIDAIATTIAGLYADLDVVYAGAASRPPTQVSSEPDVDGDVVWWINESDALRYMASYRWLLTPTGNAVNDLFAFTGEASMTQEFAAYPSEPEPRRATDDEWLEIVERLLGPAPQVSATGDPGNGDAAGLTESGLDLASPAARPVPNDDGSWTVEISLAESRAFPDGGAIEFSMGPRITLVYYFQPGVTYESIALDAPLVESEARRYVELINTAATEPAPATTTTDGYPTTGPPQQTGLCATNPVPSDDVLDLATHIAADRTPLDLDQDGIDDEMLIYTEVYADGDDSWFLLAHLQTGWTNPIELWRFAGGGTPTLTPSPDGVPAAYDLDGDGSLEFFVGGFGNTARSSAIVSLAGCELQRPRADGEAGDPLRDGLLLIGVGGNSCAPTGCWPRITCTGNLLRVENVGPTEEWRGKVPDDLAEVEVVATRSEYTLSNQAELVQVSGEARTLPATAINEDESIPGYDDSDLIDCTP